MTGVPQSVKLTNVVAVHLGGEWWVLTYDDASADEAKAACWAQDGLPSEYCRLMRDRVGELATVDGPK